MFKNISLFSVAAAWLAVPAFADTVSYDVIVNTSSISGANGYVELQLNTGSLPAATVNASVQNFTGATLNAANPNNFSSTGAFPLPGTLNLTASSSTDYFEAATFGDSITFKVALSGLGVSLSGKAGSSSDTDFIVDFLNSTGSVYLLTSDANGVVGFIDVSPAGTVSTIANPNPSGGPSLVTFTPVTSMATPEPGTIGLAGVALLLFLASRRPS